MQNKAKLLKDDTWCQGEEHDKLKESVSQLPEDLGKQLDAIKRNKVNWNNEDTGFNIDDEFDDEEIGNRFTKLRPDEERRGRGRRPPRDNRRRRDEEESKEEQAPKKK